VAGIRSKVAWTALLLRVDHQLSAFSTDPIVCRGDITMVASPRLDLSNVIRDDDLRPLVISWMVAAAAAAAWLTLVYLTPTVVVIAKPLVPPADPPIIAPDFGPAAATPTPPTPTKAAHSGGGTTVRHTDAPSPLDAAGIFAAAATTKAVAAILHALPGVETVAGNVGAHPSAGAKSALSAAEDGSTPGMAKLGAGSLGGANGVGQVRHTGAVGAAAFHAQPLPTVTAPALDGSLVDATELGSFVRGRVAQLQTCYELAGGTDLAGVVALRITIGAGGTVRSAEIVRRSWSGPGAAEAESCLLRIVRGWQIPSAGDGASVTLPISFTRGT
jgi:TonB family protein